MADPQLITDAFRTIASIVHEFGVQGRVCRGATLKPEYLRRVPLLTEQALGFRKFGDLLRAAERAGYVSVTPRLGADLELTPPVATSESAAAPPPRIVPDDVMPPGEPIALTGAVRVRPDLWRAFNSNSVSYSYSRQRDLALPASSAGGGDPSLVPVPNLSDKVRSLMRDFASTHQIELGSDLVRQLLQARHRYDCEIALRAFPALLKRWRAAYLAFVLAEIKSWAAQNDVTLRNLIGSFRGTARETVASGGITNESVPASSSRFETGFVLADELDRRCASLLDTLIGELLQLRGLLSVAQAKRG
jgi:hypothetical protein